MKFCIWIFFENLPRKFVVLKCDRNNGYFTWILCTFMIISRWIIRKMRIVSDKSCKEYHNIHFVFNNFFFSENLAACEIMWKDMAISYRSRMTVRRMRVARCITKATDTRSEYVILVLIPFPLQQWLRGRASLLRLHVHCLSCLYSFLSVCLCLLCWWCEKLM